MFSGIGTTELLIIAIVILIFFGGKKLNELARGLGESTKEIKHLKKEYKKALEDDSLDIGNVDINNEELEEKKESKMEKKTKQKDKAE